MTHENPPNALSQARRDKYKRYWTFRIDREEPFEAEFETMLEALVFAENAFCEQCESESIRTDEEREIELINFMYKDDGDMFILRREKALVHYAYYHGDFAEHNTIGR